MKSLFVFCATTLLVGILLYLWGSFVVMSFDVNKWESFFRFFAGFIAITFGLMTSLHHWINE